MLAAAALVVFFPVVRRAVRPFRAA